MLPKLARCVSRLPGSNGLVHCSLTRCYTSTPAVRAPMGAERGVRRLPDSNKHTPDSNCPKKIVLCGAVQMAFELLVDYVTVR